MGKFIDFIRAFFSETDTERLTENELTKEERAELEEIRKMSHDAETKIEKRFAVGEKYKIDEGKAVKKAAKNAEERAKDINQKEKFEE